VRNQAPKDSFQVFNRPHLGSVRHAHEQRRVGNRAHSARYCAYPPTMPSMCSTNAANSCGAGLTQ